MIIMIIIIIIIVIMTINNMGEFSVIMIIITITFKIARVTACDSEASLRVSGEVASYNNRVSGTLRLQFDPPPPPGLQSHHHDHHHHHPNLGVSEPLLHMLDLFFQFLFPLPILIACKRRLI